MLRFVLTHFRCLKEAGKMSNEPVLPVSEVYRIADKQSRPWVWCCLSLFIIVLGLLYYICSIEIVTEALTDADNITADTLQTSSHVRKE